MKDWILSLLQELLKQKLTLLFALLIPIQTACFVFLRTYLLPHLADPTGLIALIAITISISLLLVGLVTYFWFRPKFKHLPLLGVHENIKTGAYFCSCCFLKNKLHSPLTTTSNGWKCGVCGKWQEDPNNPVMPIPIKHHYERI